MAENEQSSAAEAEAAEYEAEPTPTSADAADVLTTPAAVVTPPAAAPAARPLKVRAPRATALTTVTATPGVDVARA